MRPYQQDLVNETLPIRPCQRDPVNKTSVILYQRDIVNETLYAELTSHEL